MPLYDHDMAAEGVVGQGEKGAPSTQPPAVEDVEAPDSELMDEVRVFWLPPCPSTPRGIRKTNLQPRMFHCCCILDTLDLCMQGHCTCYRIHTRL